MGSILLTDIRDDVGTITLNRPERINAFNWEMLEEMHKQLDKLAKNENLTALIIAAAGDKGFCSGVDLEVLESLKSPSEARNFAKLLEETMLKLYQFPLPVISQVHGVAYGGGFGLAMSTDIRLLESGTVIRFPAVKIGAILPITCTIRLNSIIGQSRAKELLLSGRGINTDEALMLGMAHAIGSKEHLKSVTEDYLTEFRKANKQALILQKIAANQQIVAEISKYAVQSAENFAYFYASGNWINLRMSLAAGKNE